MCVSAGCVSASIISVCGGIIVTHISAPKTIMLTLLCFAVFKLFHMCLFHFINNIISFLRA